LDGGGGGFSGWGGGGGVVGFIRPLFEPEGGVSAINQREIYMESGELVRASIFVRMGRKRGLGSLQSKRNVRDLSVGPAERKAGLTLGSFSGGDGKRGWLALQFL